MGLVLKIGSSDDDSLTPDNTLAGLFSSKAIDKRAKAKKRYDEMNEDKSIGSMLFDPYDDFDDWYSSQEDL